MNISSDLDKYSLPDTLIISDLKWKFLLRSIIKGKNVMITGAHGSAKTKSAVIAASCFKDRPFFPIPLGASQDPRATLIGNTHYKDKTFFSQSYFVRAIQIPNAIILLDELSRSHPEAMNILMSPLDYSLRFLRIDEDVDSPTIKVADGVSFISTCNIGAQYTTTRVLDRALVDRFSIIEIDLLTKEQEEKLLLKLFPNISEAIASAIASIAHETRIQIKSDNPKISTIISTRTSIEIAEAIDDGFKLIDLAEVMIYPYFSDLGGNDSERSFIKKIVQKYYDEKMISTNSTKIKQSKPW